MPPGARIDPYLDFRFHVQIESIVVAGFSEVGGLEVEVGTLEYEEGGRNDYTHELPGRASHAHLELRKGLTVSRALIDWMRDVATGTVERKNVFVFLMGTEGLPEWGWQCEGAYPVRYSAPDLQADGNEVAVETLELAHRGLTPMGLGE